MKMWTLLSCSLLALPVCLLAADAVDRSVPVRLLGEAPPPAQANMARRPARPMPEATGGMLPQYQSSRTILSAATTTPAQPALRFILALTDRIVLIETAVTINGEPFAMIREQRIDRLLAELNKPVEATPAPAPQEDAGDDARDDGATPEPREQSPPAELPVESTDDESTDDESAAEDAPAGQPDDEPDDEPKDEDGEEAEAESTPPVALISVPSMSLDARLRRYAAVTGRVPSHDEVRWLLSNWAGGPPLLLLDENFQRFRSEQAPALHVLDRDMDGNVSAEELEAAQKTLLSCDVNQNDVVEYTEIAAVAKDPRRQRQATSIQTLIPIRDARELANALRRLVQRYGSAEPLQRLGADARGQLDAAGFAALAEMEPDVSIAVSFDAAHADRSTVTITHLSTALAGDDPAVHSLGPSLTVELGEARLEFSAVQPAATSQSDQISVGVVNDGFPLLPAIDPNEDGRLTIRELRRVLDHLRSFDGNRDGQISSDEIPTTVRVAIGLGPSVHRHLADIRTVHPPTSAPRVAAPDWFRQWDANQDGDISSREFLLGDEKFKQFDTDSDELISPSEAAAAAAAAAKKVETKNVKPAPDAKPERATATP